MIGFARAVIFVLILLFCLIASNAHAHKPVFLEDTSTGTIITDPEISKAFYGELNGKRAAFTLIADKEFNFYISLLSPDAPGARKDYSARVTSSSGELIATLDGTKTSWVRWYEKFGGDWYWQGPEFRTRLPKGHYNISVYNPELGGKFVLATGEVENFKADEGFKVLKQLYAVKTRHFSKAGTSVFQGRIGLALAVASLIFILIAAISAFKVIKSLKKEKN